MPTLRNIELHVSYIPSKGIEDLLVGKSKEEQNKITTEDYNNNMKQRNSKFRLQTRNITAFYERCLKGYKNDKCCKINIECAPNSVIKSSVVLGIYTVHIPYDIDNFFKLNDFDKKRKTLDLINIAIEHIVEKEQWDKIRFDEAYNQIISENYINTWIWKKQKHSPNRKYIAKVFCEHDIYYCDIGIIIVDKSGQIIKKEVVVTEIPTEWVFIKYFGDLKWISNNELEFIGKDGNSRFTIKI